MTKLKLFTLSTAVAATLVGSLALAHNGFFADGSPVGSMYKGMMAMHGDDYSAEMMAEHHKDGMSDMHGDDYSAEMMAAHHKDGMSDMHGDDYSAEMMAAHHKDGMSDMHGDDYSAEMMAAHHKDGMMAMHAKGHDMSLPDFTELSGKLNLNNTQQALLSAMLTAHQVMHDGQNSDDSSMHHDEMMADMPEHQAQMQAHQELFDQLWASFTTEQQAIWTAEMGACHSAKN